jgi:hypothetical protein
MADENVAGSIVVQLKAQIEGLQKGIASAKATLEDLGKSVQGAATQVNQGGNRIGTTFDEMDRKSLRLASRMALLANRLLGLQIVLQTVGTRFQGTRFSQEMQTATDALTAFGSIVAVMPNKAGLAVGAFAALATVITSLVGPTKKEREEMERVLELLKNLDAARKKIEATRKLTEQDFQRRKRLGVTDDRFDELEQENKELDRLIKQRESYLEELAAVTAKLDARVLEIDGPPLKPGEREKLIDDINRLEGFVTHLNEKIADGQLKKAFSVINKEMREFVTLTQQGAKNAEILVRHGLISPIQALQIEVHQTEQQLQRAFEFQAQLEKILPGSGAALNTKIAESVQKLKLDREQLNRALQVDRMANNLSSAVGEGIVNGILSGKSAMETLADVGKNLFENALRDVVGVFQQGMTAAFKTITGVAGVELGGLITGLLGVAGAIFSQRSQEKASETFTNVRDNIESTQAVRGIVAGPSSVAIAAVGENLSRAIAPVVQRLDAVVTVLVRVEKNTRGGPAGGDSDLSAVGVPTSFASA